MKEMLIKTTVSYHFKGEYVLLKILRTSNVGKEVQQAEFSLNTWEKVT